MRHLSLGDRCVQNRSNPEIHSRNLIFWEQLPLISTAAELGLWKYCTKLLVLYQAGQFREISGLEAGKLFLKRIFDNSGNIPKVVEEKP
jgi:hypothetical protein